MQVSILLTKYSDWISSLVYLFCGSGYTHSSIALEEHPKLYYSFNYRGFALETIEKHRRRGVRHSRCYQIEVSDAIYAEIKKNLNDFKEHQEEYHYTRLGVLCCILHIPFHWKKHYFCSQFVAEILVRSKAVHLETDSACYLPNHLIPLLETQAESIRIVEDPI